MLKTARQTGAPFLWLLIGSIKAANVTKIVGDDVWSQQILFEHV